MIHMNKKIIFSIGIIIGILASTSFFVLTDLSGFSSDAESIASELGETYEMANPNIDYNVLNINQRNGLYEIIFETGSGTHQTVYTTKDGELMAQGIVQIEQFRENIQNRIDFFNCLRDENVRIFGALQTQNQDIVQSTQLQIETLGGIQHMEDIYYECGGDNIEQCMEIGVEEVPSVEYQGEFYDGVHDFEWFEEITGCSTE